jgi:hypothetical protein
VRDFDRASADNHALAVCGRQPGMHEIDHLCDREAMRRQHCLGHAVATAGKQLERAASVRLGAAQQTWSAGVLPLGSVYRGTLVAIQANSGPISRLRTL